jgi:hypothetical protein
VTPEHGHFSNRYLSPTTSTVLARLSASLPQHVIVTLTLLILAVTACISQYVRDAVDQRTALDSIGGLHRRIEYWKWRCDSTEPLWQDGGNLCRLFAQGRTPENAISSQFNSFWVIHGTVREQQTSSTTVAANAYHLQRCFRVYL